MGAVIQSASVHDTFGHDIVAVAPLGGSMKTFVSPNMCDRTTWYPDSTDVIDEVLTDSGDGLTFDAVNDAWINKANIVDSHEITGKDVTVKVDDVEQTSGFTVNHSAGTVTFDASQSGNVVKASYSHGGSPGWEVVPSEGKILRVVMSEVQISKNFVFNADILFKVMMQTSADTWVSAGTNRYKNAKDLIARANRGYTIPAFGELTQDVVVMPFEYPAVIDLTYTKTGLVSPALKIELGLSADIEMGGEFGCVAIYCMSRDE